MQTTTNLGLKKPDKNEYVNIEDLNYNADEVDRLGAPEYDDSGTVTGITSFPSYLATLVSGTNFYTFFRNLKAGLQFVLHVGQLTSQYENSPSKIPTAALVYALKQSLDTTNSNLNNITEWEALSVSATENTESVSAGVYRNNALGLYFIRGTFTLKTNYTAGTVLPVLNIPARTALRAPVQLYNVNTNINVDAIALGDKISIVHDTNLGAPVVMSICAMISV